jgi:hypothetical protein
MYQPISDRRRCFFSDAVNDAKGGSTHDDDDEMEDQSITRWADDGIYASEIRKEEESRRNGHTGSIDCIPSLMSIGEHLRENHVRQYSFKFGKST